MSSKPNLKTDNLDLKELLEKLNDLVRNFSQVANERNLDFYVHFNRSLPQKIFTDRKRLQQILNNLLSNAFKFTEEGYVSLTVSLTSNDWIKAQDRLDSYSEYVAFAVSDTGIGVAADKQELIFEGFQQGDGTTSRKYGGTGLGLSISRELAESLGGKIDLTNEVNKGSTFTLYLPQSPACSSNRDNDRDNLTKFDDTHTL
ncbi:MAG: ATP-binding protein [Prochloraceae cyanobacterium]